MIVNVGNPKLAAIEFVAVQTRLEENEINALLRVARQSANYSIGSDGGPEGKQFERAFVEQMACGDAVSVNSCSSALELAAILSELKPGNEVILPAHTFVASAVPFGKTGATLCWADIHPETRVISAETIKPLITRNTRAIVVVHLYGMPADMDPILALAQEHGIIVIEDCAQAPGARYRGRHVGTLGDYGCFSFHGQKNITTLGEGGMLAVKDPAMGRGARRMRWMGIWPFETPREKDWVPAGVNLVQPVPGRWPGNYCMPEAFAAVGTELLKRLDAVNQQRREQSRRFIDALSDYPELSFQRVPTYCEHVYHLLSARYDGQAYGKTRDDLMLTLRNKYNLKCIVQYWPLNRSELFRTFGFADAHVPETDRFFDNMISFPWWSNMENHLIDDMADRTRSALDDLRRNS
jgi:dTDP-4-amino-4,6-dideoxygalactose transaminase